MALVSTPGEVAEIAERLARSSLVAFDLEFMSADRLVPGLCLVQVAWLPDDITLDAAPAEIVAAPEVRLVDPLATETRPIIEALAAHPLVVAHAPRQDLGLLAARFGTSMPGIIDTQLMAAFAGVGDQVGLATLGNELLGLGLAKDQQWTAWDRRPLSEAQLTYAAADVRHLPLLYKMLAARLGERLAWAREESVQVLGDALAAAAVTPETAWQNVGGARGIDPSAHAALVALAAWRYRTAVELDRPLGQVLNDKVLIELAKQRPDDEGGVRAQKGMSPIAKTRAKGIVAAIEDATPTKRGPKPAWQPASARARRWSDLLLEIAQLIADDTKIAARLLATRSDAEEFARAVDERGLAAAGDLPALSTWRRDVLGTVWSGFLAGTLQLVGDVGVPHGLRLVPGVARS